MILFDFIARKLLFPLEEKNDVFENSMITSLTSQHIKWAAEVDWKAQTFFSFFFFLFWFVLS